VPFPPRIDAARARALGEVGLNTAEKLDRFMEHPRFRGKVRSFSTSQGIKEKEVSYLALVMIAVGMKIRTLFGSTSPISCRISYDLSQKADRAASADGEIPPLRGGAPRGTGRRIK
jgi:hypothetical protein